MTPVAQHNTKTRKISDMTRQETHTGNQAVTAVSVAVVDGGGTATTAAATAAVTALLLLL